MTHIGNNSSNTVINHFNGTKHFGVKNYLLGMMTAVLYYRWLAAGLHYKIISQGVGGHRVYVGNHHPMMGLRAPQRKRPGSRDTSLGTRRLCSRDNSMIQLDQAYQG